MQRRLFHQPQVRNYVPRANFNLSDQAETPANISYFTPEPEVEEKIDFIKYIEEKISFIKGTEERIKFIKDIEEKIRIFEKFEAKDTGLMIPVQDHDRSTVPVLLKVAGKAKTLDVSQEQEPDQETIDMLAKIGHPSWKEFRKEILFINSCTRDSDKAPLFPKQNSTTMPPREASHSPQETRGGDFRGSCTIFDPTQPADTSRDGKRVYIYEEAKDHENSGESLADPLHQSHGADDAQEPKNHTFFRFPLGEGNVFQIVPESEAELLPPEDVRSFLGLKDRDLDVAKQVTSAIGILDSTGPEQDDIQLDNFGRLDDLARDLEAIGGGNETGEQEIRDDDEKDPEMEDVNSNPVGVTYTESCITGISWDYSALFP
jgi:hypothetical protein